MVDSQWILVVIHIVECSRLQFCLTVPDKRVDFMSLIFYFSIKFIVFTYFKLRHFCNWSVIVMFT